MNATQTSVVSGFDIITLFIDDDSDNDIEIHLFMKRRVTPFFFKYFVPCMAIVAVSQISFIIPPNAIPGRIGLIVTQFLTLTNIFIYQMVSFDSFYMPEKVLKKRIYSVV